MKKTLSFLIIISSLITYSYSAHAQSVSTELCTNQNVFSTPNSGDFALDEGEKDQARKAMNWIYTMMEPLGSTSNGGEIYLDQVYGFDHINSVSGGISLDDLSRYPIINPSPLTVISPANLEDSYRGVVAGEVSFAVTPGAYEVRAYLFTDAEYLQSAVIPGVVDADGLWSLDLSTVPSSFMGSWRFRLYEISTDNQIGESWPQENILENLEISLFSVTDAEYFIATQKATPDLNFNFDSTTIGTKRVKLIDNKRTDTATDDIVLDSYTGGTGLVRSYELSPGDEGFGTPFQERSYVYDQALSLSSALSFGELNKASDLVNGLILSQQSGGVSDGAFFFSVPQLSPTTGDTIFRTGAHSIALYSLLQYIQTNPNDSNIDTYRNSAYRALAYLDTLKVTSGPQQGLYLGGSGRYISDAYQDYDIPWASTEHNLDTWHTFKKAYKVFDDEDYLNKATSLEDSIIAKLWNPVTQRFYQGYGPNEPDPADALDTSSWGSMMLIGVGEKAKSESSLDRLSVYQYTDVETGITGWGPYTNTGGYPGAIPTVWYEGSFGVLMAYARNNLGSLYQSTLDDLKRGQLPSGAFRYATDRDVTYEIITAPSVASTAWYILSTVGRDNFWQECSFVENHNKNTSSGGRVRLVCTDQQAINFKDSRFARSDNSLCKYSQVFLNKEEDNKEERSQRKIEDTSTLIQETVDSSGDTFTDVKVEYEINNKINIIGASVKENIIYESVEGITPVIPRSDYSNQPEVIKKDTESTIYKPIVVEQFSTFWEILIQFFKNIITSIIDFF